MASSNGHQIASFSSQTETANYSLWSNEELIKRVGDLEVQLRTRYNQHVKEPSATASPPPTLKKPKKSPKAFDPSKYSTRHIALKFAYLGARYNGLEHHANNPTRLPTVEEEIWKALMKTKLIFPDFKEGQSKDEVCWDGCEYSKCGRTDRGVSAFGQVIGLRVRSSRPKAKPISNGEDSAHSESIDLNGIGLMAELAESHEASGAVSESAWNPIKDELPYIQLLNRVLPADIKVLAWCPNPPPDFSARFNCKERRYRYFFTNPAYMPYPGSTAAGSRDAWLDINAMQEAAKKLEGLHDFRNFCKVDPSKQIINFKRRIFHASIRPTNFGSQSGAFLTANPFTSPNLPQMYCFEVRGSAFLWHQVRHMVAILFLVGQGYEPPTIVDKLIDVQNCSAKPVYEMADEIPLVLWECVFPDLSNLGDGEHDLSNSSTGYEDALDWVYVGDSRVELAGGKGRAPTEAMQDRKYGHMGIMDDLWAQWRKAKMREMLAGSLMDVVAQQSETSPRSTGAEEKYQSTLSARVFDGGELPRNVGSYVPIMQRARMETPEVVNARYAVRKGLNGALGASHGLGIP